MGNPQFPAVTVGLMAFNEEKYLAKAIESILKQGYPVLELIIGDNASTDSTPDIAAKALAENPSIKILRHERNVGAIENFNRLVRAGTGKYFVLAGAHDLWSENYLAELVAGMEARPGAVHAFGLTAWIDGDGKPVETWSGFTDTSDFDAFRRFWFAVFGNQNSMYGIYRMDALRKTRLQRQIVGSGLVLLSELALLGEFAFVNGPVWFRRINRDPESRKQRLKRYRRILYNRKRFHILPHWIIPWELFLAIIRTRIGFVNRILLLFSLPAVFLLLFRNLMTDIGDLFGITGK